MKWKIIVSIAYEVEMDLYAKTEETVLEEAEDLWGEGRIELLERDCQGGEVDGVEAVNE